jgi:hypothetical protein
MTKAGRAFDGPRKLHLHMSSDHTIDDVRPFVVFQLLLFLEPIHFRLRVNFSLNLNDNIHDLNITC